MKPTTMVTLPPRLTNRLVRDELFDLTLYRRLKSFAAPETATLLDMLIKIEEGHLAFWQHFLKSEITALDPLARLRLTAFALFARIFGEAGIHLILEAIEVNGIRKYLSLWETYKDEPLGAALKNILNDELKHEDEIVSASIAKKIHPERIRDVFLGLNDGLVEILGAISGFFAAFHTSSAVLVAGFTVAVAGSISMAAGVFAALSSQREVSEIEVRKKKFLGEAMNGGGDIRPLSSGVIVGISYFIGAMVPVLPVLFGAQSLILPVLVAGVVIILISYILGFLSGMDIRRRIALNLVIIAIAVGITYVIGSLANQIWGLEF